MLSNILYGIAKPTYKHKRTNAPHLLKLSSEKVSSYCNGTVLQWKRTENGMEMEWTRFKRCTYALCKQNWNLILTTTVQAIMMSTLTVTKVLKNCPAELVEPFKNGSLYKDDSKIQY